MKALLSFDKAPPFAAPLRFFLTAPLFGVLAGVLLSLLLYLNRTSKPGLRSLVPDAADPQRKLVERRAGAAPRPCRPPAAGPRP